MLIRNSIIHNSTHMPDSNIVYEGLFEIGTYDIDSQKCLTIPAMTKMMHEAAMQNVLHLKLSYWDLIPYNITWVLMRKRMEILRRPSLGEKIRIVTHPAGFEKFFTYRDFKVYDEENQLIASASSTWLLMDTVKRRMANIPDFIRNKEMPDMDFLPHPERKIPQVKDVQFSKDYQVGWFELDWNEHLNNIHYLIKMLDVLPLDIHKNASLQRMDIIFKMESRYNDEIVSEAQVDATNEHSFFHRIAMKETGKEIALGRTFWK